MPEIDPAFSHLWELFQFAGCALQTGMGLVPLSWQEIESFCKINCLDLTLFEVKWLREMSDAYCTEYSRATDPKRPAPYAVKVESEEIDEVQALEQARNWRSLIRSHSRKK